MAGTDSTVSTGGAEASGVWVAIATGSSVAAGAETSGTARFLTAIGFSSRVTGATGGFAAPGGGGATTMTGRVAATEPAVGFHAAGEVLSAGTTAGDLHPADEDLSVGTPGLATTAPEGGRLAIAGAAGGGVIIGGAWRGCGTILRGSGRAGAAAAAWTAGGAVGAVCTTGLAACVGGAAGLAGVSG